MSYLYFGSRWGEDKNQIIEIFFKYNILFAGLDSKEQIFNYKKYNIGTKIAVTDGFTIKAVGKTIEEFTSLDKLDIDFTDEELSKFQVGDWVLAAKVNLYKLDKKDWGWYDAAYKRVEPIKSLSYSILFMLAGFIQTYVICCIQRSQHLGKKLYKSSYFHLSAIPINY